MKKKLIEVALPLEAINAACKADKDRKTGTIRNLHKWFAPMPVPALRALIFASLVDDPGDDAERQRLLRLIEELVASVVENPPARVLDEAKKAIKDSVGELPTVLDPFCGGGSTLVEAQRLGLPSRGSDLNPIPVLISKVLTELPPSLVGKPPISGSDGRTTWSGLDGFLVDVEHYAQRVREQAWQRIGYLYPLAPNGDPVIAWWWARTVESPDPRFQGCHVPLVNDWWLSKKKGEEAFVEPVVDISHKTVHYKVRTTGRPTATRKDACLFSGAPISFKYIRDRGLAGELGTELLAVISHGAHGRAHHDPDESQIAAVALAKPESSPTLSLPEKAIGFRVQGYGMSQWSDLFSPRQQVALETFAELVSQVPEWVISDGGSAEQSVSIAAALGICVGKLAQHLSCLVRWYLDTRNGSGKATSAFGRHDLSMTWDYAEINPFGGSVGDWMQIVSTSTSAFRYVEPKGPRAEVIRRDARTAGEGLEGSCLVVTDPPYFSAIGYANLSDYFYLWIRQALRGVFPDLFATMATPKSGELIAEPARHVNKDEAKQYFIDGFTEAFGSLKTATRPGLPMLIVYAYKEQEAERDAHVSSGWEAMLEAVIRSGHTVVGTWPIHGAGSARMVGIGNNALATYVVLVCRPRESGGQRVPRRDFASALRAELGPAIELLQQAAVAPVDMAQAVVGPGMAVFTRYEAVLESDGSSMTVRSALLLINSVLTEVRGEREGDFDPETRWAIEWFEEHRFDTAPSGEAIALAQAKVTNIDALERSGVIIAKGGRTQLVSRASLPNEYEPRDDLHPTVWEGLQHLVKAFEKGGEVAAANLYARLPNVDAIRELAYALFAVCEKRSWAEEASAYNALVASWPEIARLAADQVGRLAADDGRLPGF